MLSWNTCKAAFRSDMKALNYASEFNASMIPVHMKIENVGTPMLFAPLMLANIFASSWNSLPADLHT